MNENVFLKIIWFVKIYNFIQIGYIMFRLYGGGLKLKILLLRIFFPCNFVQKIYKNALFRI